MRRLTTICALAYIAITVTVTSARTGDMIDRLEHASNSVSSHVDDYQHRFVAYPHFREAQKKRLDFWAKPELAIPLFQQTTVSRHIALPERKVVLPERDLPLAARSPPTV